MNTTAFIGIISDNLCFELSCIMDDENRILKEPMMEWKKFHKGSSTSIDLWDNSTYIKKLMKSIKKDKKDWRTKQLKKFCKKHDFNFNHAKEDMIEMYTRSKQLKMW